MSNRPTATPDPLAHEAEVADYLARTPGFFERHAELLARVQLTSPHGKRAVSLQERQLEILRERIRGLESKIMEMIRHGQENVAIVDRMHRWTRALMLVRQPGDVPEVMVEQLKQEFLIPMAALRLWDVEPAFYDKPFARDVGATFKAFAADLGAPYCGVNAGFEAAAWLDDTMAPTLATLAAPRGGASAASERPGAADSRVASMALLPLHHARGVVGVLALGSPDPTRYSAEMGTELLSRIGEIASAAVARLIRPA